MLEWQHANGGWAVLLTGGETAAQAQAATLQADLVKVASNLSWTPTPFKFAYGHPAHH